MQGVQRARGLALRVHPLLGLEERQPEHAHRMQAEDDQDAAGNLAEERQAREHELADRRR